MFEPNQAQLRPMSRIIRKNAQRFSEKIMPKQQAKSSSQRGLAARPGPEKQSFGFAG
jgi:hypothetical protein